MTGPTSSSAQRAPYLDGTVGGRHGNVTSNGSDFVDGGNCNPFLELNVAEANKHSVTDAATPDLHGKASFTPMAICGMACRLPGGITSPSDLWKFLIEGRDARTRVPSSRYNIDTYHSSLKKPDTTTTPFGYFLDSTQDLAALDSSFFSISRSEMERLDPQQRMFLEVSRESLDDACEIDWKGKNIGVYCGTYGQDWYDVFQKDVHKSSAFQVVATHDFMVSERVSHEMDLQGPSMTFRTACSSSLIALNEACMALARGDCEAAIVGGTNIVMSPAHVTASSAQGVFSPDGSCKTFSAEANGYARGEGIVSLFVKPLADAIRDGNPVRAVLTGTATNSDGKTLPLSMPSAAAQARLIRRAYEVAGISDVGKTALFECHGTGTNIGDPIETNAVAEVFGKEGIYISSIKPNIGHAEGAAGLTSLVKAVLALEHKTIPPNIKFGTPNPKIPWESAKLKVPTTPTPWPDDRDERISINSFGIGGSNAHCIVESAENFHAARKNGSMSLPSDQSHLILLSANTAPSLKDMIDSYRGFLEHTSHDLADVAHTLANRRQHLPHRSFMIASKERDVIVTAANPPLQKQKPSLVLVFTGQGAQWAGMGKDLLRSSPIFRETILSLDKYLKSQNSIVPDWTIEEELAKSARLSRVNEAEFSQPLCTAVQVGLVNVLASAGIKPKAVVGHSSGEIGAAYAAGALAAREAIMVAYLRGLASKYQSKSGGMAAIGMSWDDVKQYLIPGVVVACHNSHKGVTLSGDADKLNEVVSSIRKAKPDVLATTLKVEKAYHSHHMEEVGELYHSAMRDAGVVGKGPSIPFFSSVTGELLTTTAKGTIGPRYWQSNLQNPVLFKEAICNILKHPGTPDPVFLEVGPHAALAGPIRQMLTQESSEAVHVPTLARKQNGDEAILMALGKLWSLGVELDFKNIASGNSVPGLPVYPWDHRRTYWYESRLSKEWRLGGFPYHDLLGRKVPESSEHHPMWRNLLYLNNVPWIADHKIDQGIVFPFSAFVAMAAEAIQQTTTGKQNTLCFRDMHVSTALPVSEDSNEPTELVTSLHQDSAKTDWWRFTISSHNGQVWTKHCKGMVRAEANAMKESQLPKHLPRNVSAKSWYEAVRRKGLDYGESFQCLQDIMTSTTSPHLASAKLVLPPAEDDGQYHIHPSALESCFQLLCLAVRDGQAYTYKRQVPMSFESLTLSRTSANDLSAFASGSVVGGDTVGNGTCFSGSQPVLQVSGVKLALFEAAEANAKPQVPITSRTELVPCIDFEESDTLIKRYEDEVVNRCKLDHLLNLALQYGAQVASEAKISTPHLQKYAAWLKTQHADISFSFSEDEREDMENRIHALADQHKGTSNAPIAAAILGVCRNLPEYLSGEQNIQNLLNTGDLGIKLDDVLTKWDTSTFLRHFAHCKPNSNILELGAGSGADTTHNLTLLKHDQGQLMYSQYTMSDPSAGRIKAANEQPKGTKNLECSTLDVSKDLGDFGFEERDFDLIIAKNVLSKSPDLQNTLNNVRQLLTANGRLLLQEPLSGNSWAKFVMGLVPAWWVGEKDPHRKEEPYVSLAQWKDLLKTASLEIHGEPVEDGQGIAMIVKPVSERRPAKRLSVLQSKDSNTEESRLILERLKVQGYELETCTLHEKPPAGQDVIALLDLESPLLDTMDEKIFENLKTFANNLAESGVFWITRPCQSKIKDPRYASMIGFSRTMRNELALDFATCEVDTIDFQTATAIGGVVDRFHERGMDGVLGPDFEYAIVDDEVFVNRIFPFALDNDIQSVETDTEATLVSRRSGRLDSVEWDRIDVQPLDTNDVGIEVYATGLNLQDVNIACGGCRLPEMTFGYGAAGVVRRVGPKASSLQVGDRVMYMGPRAFSTILKAPESMFVRLDPRMSFEEGATLPLAFVAAIYGLLNVGRLLHGQTVMICNPYESTTQAAVQVAGLAGGEVHLTAKNEEDAMQMSQTWQIPVSRIYTPDRGTFAEQVSQQTNHRGVDVAFGSVEGELLDKTFACLGDCGVFVNVARLDSSASEQLLTGLSSGNRSYSSLDVFALCANRPQALHESLQRFHGYLHDGAIQASLERQVFEASEVVEAFRYKQKAGDGAQVAVRLRNDSGELLLGEALDKTTQAHLDSKGSYLIVGGLGGLGRSISIWMAQHGARKFVYLSRSAGSNASDTAFAKELESLSCTVRFVKGSVVDSGSVACAVKEASSLGPLKGVLQMSMALRDQAFRRMTKDDWDHCVQPKVQGTWNLHEATKTNGSPLDFFILFSSLSGIVGQTGQANYAAANTFLDAFVDFRESQGLPCTCITLGAMEGVGYLTANPELLAKMQGSGWRPNQEVELLDAVNAAIILSKLNKQRSKSRDTLSPSIVDPNKFCLGISPSVPLSSPDSYTQLRQDIRMAVWHNVGAERQSSGSGSSNDALRPFLMNAKKTPDNLKSQDAINFLATEIGRKLLGLLLKPDEGLSIASSTTELGLDSMVAVELRAWWKLNFGFDVPVMEMLSAGTLEALGRRAANGLLALYG